MDSFGLEEVRAAAHRIGGAVHRTPVITSRIFDEMAGVQAFFKCENLQRAGAFKIRGASNFILSASADRIRAGVVAFSSGNHAQAVALAARDLGCRATIVMPSDAPRLKIEATRHYGAEIVYYDRLRDDREQIARQLSSETGAVLIPPYDHPWIIAGQGTVALEFLEQVPDLEALLICVGGGGLLAGCSLVARAVKPRLRVFGAEPELANDTFLSFRKGEPVEIMPPDTIADGLRAVRPGALTFPIVRRNVEDILLVSEEEIRRTVPFLFTRMKLVVEPSGAVAPAAALFRKLPSGLRRIGIVISGGNMDPGFLSRLETTSP